MTKQVKTVLIIVGVFAAALAFYFYDQSRTEDCINNPVIGDVFTLESESGIISTTFNLYRVISFTDSTLVLNPGLYETTSIRSLHKLDDIPDDEMWSFDEITYSKKELHEMNVLEGPVIIHSVDRSDD